MDFVHLSEVLTVSVGIIAACAWEFIFLKILAMTGKGEVL